MPLTISEIVRELEKLRHSRAVWMETVEHLSRFIDQEVKPAEHGIVAEGCIESPVPQPVVKEFIDYINNEEIEPLNQKIEQLESLTVEETEDDEGPKKKDSKPAGKEAGQKEKPGSKIRPVGKKIPRIGKGSGSPGRKAQSSG